MSRIFTRAALHLGALWALAFVQPMFGLLGDSAEFFVARGNTTFDILVFAFGFALVPPLVAAGLVALVGRPLLVAFVGLLVAALVLPPLGDLLGGSAVAIVVAALVGAAAAYLYARVEVVQTFLTFLSPAPLVFLAYFLLLSPVSDLLLEGESSGAAAGPAQSSVPIVHIVLDELPTSTLTGPGGSVDASLFPNLARFAAGATWYRNATTVADTTVEAVPAQVTGRMPEVGGLPTSTHHPNSLFTLFRRSHELSVVEPITDVCPASLCPEERPSLRARMSALAKDLAVVAQHLLLPDDLRDGLPSLDRGWLGFGSESLGGIEAGGGRGKLLGRVIERLEADDAVADFARVTEGLEGDSARPPLIFMHSSLPHGPARYLPDGRGYPIHRKSYPGFADGRWTRSQWLVDQSFQRHVLQTQYTDALVGRLLDRVRAAGLYDDAVIVLTADHGISFRAGHPRRRLDPVTMGDLVLVPFIVKWPGQRSGSVDDGAVRTIDALPTIAKAAGVRVPWAIDAMPADERGVDPGTQIAAMDDGKPGTPMPLGALLESVRERERTEQALLRDGVWKIGPRPDLVGRRFEGEIVAAGPSATVDGDLRAHASVVPALISGDIAGLSDDAELAIAVNGRVVATTRAFTDGGQRQYSAVLPPSSLRPGSNSVVVLQVLAGDRLRAIGPAGGT
jgi:hypothetical protein